MRTLHSYSDLERAIVAMLDSGPVHCDAGTIAGRLHQAGYRWAERPLLRGESSYPHLRYALWRMRRDGVTELQNGQLRLTSWGRK